MRPALACTTLGTAAMLYAGSAAAQPGVPLAPSFLSRLDPAVAACVLDRLGTVITESTALLLVQACTRLVHAAADSTDDRQDQLVVRCKVDGDPEWMEFRLITRQQCASAAGRVQE